ncbi:hypothetical protein [Anaeroselena agilis]|uniref:Uncharacterized protein n=1 Tax=Anaeroselena agilis TaxID=3063788 RepID=A0ABU3P284_9FIRM|nr:hypothetical protein [Selenomonadales bacterium 4137-cl]
MNTIGLKENEKLTELSAALDALNRGQMPAGGDEETKELARVALLLKRTGPPPAVVAALVDKVGDELAAKRKRRRLWLTSGAAGTAAAAVLVFAFNLGPSAPPQPQMTLPPAGSVVIESIPAPQPAADNAAGAAKAGRVKNEPAAAKRPPQVADSLPAQEGSAPGAAAGSGRSGPRTMLAKVPEKTAEPATEKPASPPGSGFLAWPGRQPEKTAVDEGAETVRRVYGHGDEAIVITQRKAATPDAVKASAHAAAVAPPDGAAKGKANRVTVTIKDMVVTVEGNLPEDELQKIARSLE